MSRLLTISSVLCGSFLVTQAAWTAEFPDWTVKSSCSNDSDVDVCLELEARARQQLSGLWRTLPSERKKYCLLAASSNDLRSFRVLKNCLDDAEPK
jgi:hypothetical protein